jgi:hypothetical protein
MAAAMLLQSLMADTVNYLNIVGNRMVLQIPMSGMAITLTVNKKYEGI